MNHTTHISDEPIVSIAASKKVIDDYVEHLLSLKIEQAAQVSPYYEALWHAIKSLFGAGGKRLRPYMTLLTYQAFGGNKVESIVPAAVAQELLHQSMLVHDDIIDRDLIRYNAKNISGQFNDYYEQFIADVPERRHFADSAAILAGDLLISEAHVQIAQSNVEPEKVLAAQNILSEAVFHVVGGELLDTEASFRPAQDIDPLTIAAQKTASYSFVSPLTLGAVLAGAPQQQLDILKDLGNSVGIAYQLRDDLMGVFGDEAVTGKSTQNDIKEGKRTLLIDEFYKRADHEQQESFSNIFGHPKASDDNIEVARTLLINSGAKTAIESYIANYREATIQQLSQMDITDDYRTIFADLIQVSLERDK